MSNDIKIVREKPKTDGLCELKEQLAAVQHDIWAHWVKYVISKCRTNIFDPSLEIPSWLAVRWRRQTNTDYKDLSEEEKKSDREQANKFWELIEREGWRLTKNEFEKPDKNIKIVREYGKIADKKGTKEDSEIINESKLLWENIKMLKRAVNANQIAITEMGKKVAELEKAMSRPDGYVDSWQIRDKKDVHPSHRTAVKEVKK